MEPRFSFIIPVYNRAADLEALLENFARVMPPAFSYEIIVVDDGSRENIRAVTGKFENLPLHYGRQENAGPGAARNRGMKMARGEWFVFLDSDVLLPEDYAWQLENALARNPEAGIIGGRDDALPDFTLFQKAVNYVMTSFCTTGGIRGNRKQVDRFVPRSFNMAAHRQVWETIGGFSHMHPGEDPEWVYKWWQAGGRTASAPDWKVYHKRRIDWRSFWRQILRFARARMILARRFPGTFKWIHLAPVVFVVLLGLALAGVKWAQIMTGLYFLCTAIEILVRSRSLPVTLTALVLVVVQNLAYAWGVWQGFVRLYVRKMPPERAFPDMFFEKDGKN